MSEEEIPFEESLDLKELGFTGTLPPTYPQSFKWFRENYELDSYILPLEDRHNPCIIGYQYQIHVPDIRKGLWNTYEEAELACLKKLIEIVKEKK